MDVLLIRHAEAGERDATRFPDDDLRPITAEGRRKQAAFARLMKRMGISFDFLVTSPLVRAMQTAEVLGEVFGLAEVPPTSDALGHQCAAPAVLALLAKFGPEAAVALVGHEPALSRVAAALIGKSGDAHLDLKKSGVIGIRFDGAPEAGKGELAFMLKPGHLKRLKA
jgi:phosphohistidine phosphatase